MKSYTINQTGTHLDSACGIDCDPCVLPVYDPGCESTGPVCPEQMCRPEPCYTFSARQAIRIQQGEIERLFDFRFYTQERNDVWVRQSMIMRLRRINHCQWQWAMCAISVTPKGEVRFRWPDLFLKAPPGYYESELIVNHIAVNKRLYFYKPFMTANVNATTAVMQECTSECNQYETQCCVPDLEVWPEDTTPIIACGDCHDR
ncbi:hypothetical protein [Xenorhabdus innexi]|uniref:Uncharacterized protein n=1 Tax=Xenorhabdus innexi TaxID=290109 RepID=A0A1N6MWS8_9GAMM|nr:hypothetical protein [Xenorhabdus innexi]PHM35925.1 hypothetical protein Xinn_01995 [Xenorhabdus innexi]SIP73224.1 hypothetical protein XIS1_1790030 [Xenorhabdus innexi]